MAKKTAKTDVTGRPVQWHDLTREGQRVVSGQMRSAGARVPEVVADQRSKADARVARSATGTAANKTARKERQVFTDIEPHVKSKPVTMTSAAKGREDQYHAANERSADKQIPDGAGWYFNHHADIAASAKEHGFDTHTAVVASAVMSPRNSPDNEKAALHGMMKAMREGTVHMTPHLASHLHEQGVPVDPNHVGHEVAIAGLHHHALAAMSDTRIRDSLQTNVPDALEGISRGGAKGQIKKAADVLVGHTSAEHAIDPHSAPKVASYAKNIADAVPNTPEHVEYMGRVSQHHMAETGQISHGQQSLDLYGYGHATPGMLSPHRTTAEDSWQNTMTFGQKNDVVGDKGRTHVGKTVGSMQGMYPAVNKTAVVEGKKVSAHPEARVGKAALHHAFNNRATQVAAENLSRGHEHALPVVAVQEIPWTEVRRSAGKDPEFKRQQAAEISEGHSEIPGQQALLGSHTPMSPRRSVAPEAPKPVSRSQFGHLEGHEHELTHKDMAAADAIGRARQAKASTARRAAGAAQFHEDFSARLASAKEHPVHGFIYPGHPKYNEVA